MRPMREPFTLQFGAAMKWYRKGDPKACACGRFQNVVNFALRLP